MNAMGDLNYPLTIMSTGVLFHSYVILKYCIPNICFARLMGNGCFCKGGNHLKIYLPPLQTEVYSKAKEYVPEESLFSSK